ncbi:MAG: DUF3078 domain-containing protein [Prevotella sp.]
MHIRYSLLLLLLLFTGVQAGAQSRKKTVATEETDSVPELVKAYVDSLAMFGRKVDSLQHLTDSLGLVLGNIDSKYYRLFVPITFYHDIATSRLRMDESPDEYGVDDVLLSLYYRRPDLVQGTQSQLDVVDPILESDRQLVAPTVDIVEKVAPTVTDSPVRDLELVVRRPNFWNYSCSMSIGMNQYCFSGNWFQGGENSFSATNVLTLNANYNNKRKIQFNNQLNVRLGLSKAESEKVHKMRITENPVRLTSNLLLNAVKHWDYSLQLTAASQVCRQLNYNSETVASNFLSPLTTALSIGMKYSISWFKGRVSGNVNMAPFAYNFTYVKRGELAPRYGVPAGDHFKDNFGSELTVNLQWNVVKNVVYNARIYAITSYKGTRIENENTLRFTVNKYINATMYFYPRFDDNVRRDDHHGYWQFKQTMSMNFNYSF